MLLSDSYNIISELLGVMDDCLLSGTVDSCSVMASQEVQRQSLLPSTSQPSASNTQLSVSDTQLSALLAGGGCPPQLTNVDELPQPRQAGDSSIPQLTNIEEPSHLGSGYPPQLTNVDEPSHSGQVSSVAHNQQIVKKSAAQVV